MRHRDEIPSPALLLDLDRFDANVSKMATHLRDRGKAFRPHAKTHKCPEIARRMIGDGAVGVCTARLSEAEAREEMLRSAEHVKVITGKTPATIAFPYGTREAATLREAAIAAELGFTAAVTTQPGVIRPGMAGGTTYLPRLSLNGLYQKPRYVSALASGIPLKLMGK